MVDERRRLGYCKEKSIHMIKFLRFLLPAMLAAVMLLILNSKMPFRVTVHGIVNGRVIPRLLMLARPGHRRPTAGVINQTTLLSYAAIELGESKERQLIDRLLDISRARSISSCCRVTQRQKAFQEFHLALRSWFQNKRFDQRVMTELGELVKAPLDFHYNATGILEIRPGQPYRSCAVVGNSGILLLKTHGPLIDSHEMVIRLKNARTEGFQDRVGSKTTLAFINSNTLHSCASKPECFCHPYGENIPIITYICQVLHFMDLAPCNASCKTPLLVTDARFDNLCGRIVKYYSLKNFVETTGKHPDKWGAAHEGPLFHYSSGMQAVMLALGICEKVSLFGFGKSPHASHHYHTSRMSELALHDYEAEYQFYHDLAAGSQDIPFLSEAGIKLPPLQIYL